MNSNLRLTCGRCLIDARAAAGNAGWLLVLSLVISTSWVILPVSGSRAYNIAATAVLFTASAAATAAQAILATQAKLLERQGRIAAPWMDASRWSSIIAVMLTVAALLMTAMRSTRHDFADNVLTVVVAVFLLFALRNGLRSLKWSRHAQRVAAPPAAPAA